MRTPCDHQFRERESGITCSVPLIEYAKELNSAKEELYRALVLSNLVAIHEKTGIGTLSAYCGAVSAGAGAGAGIVYLCGGDYQAVIHTVVNALAIVSGIVCDGAKASCAARSLFPWTPGSLVTICIKMIRNLKAVTGSS